MPVEMVFNGDIKDNTIPKAFFKDIVEKVTM